MRRSLREVGKHWNVEASLGFAASIIIKEMLSTPLRVQYIQQHYACKMRGWMNLICYMKSYTEYSKIKRKSIKLGYIYILGPNLGCMIELKIDQIDTQTLLLDSLSRLHSMVQISSSQLVERVTIISK